MGCIGARKNPPAMMADRKPAPSVFDIAAKFLEPERPVGASENINAATAIRRFQRLNNFVFVRH